MSKGLRKVIMHQSKLRYIANKKTKQNKLYGSMQFICEYEQEGYEYLLQESGKIIYTKIKK